LNHNNKNEFIVDLDNVWKWLGFSRKDPAKRLLEKFFVIDVDYKTVFHQSVENLKGGRPQEQILMTINTFKKFCLKADTKKADEIHEYYIGLEELLHETIDEETKELREQLDNNKLQNKNMIKLNNHDLFLEKFNNKRCVYLIEIEENKFIKIGSTLDIKKRIINYKRTYENASLLYLDIFECEHFREIEKNILQDAVIRKNLQRDPVYGHKSCEIVNINANFNYNQLITIIKTYLAKDTTLFTPDQILEKNRIELENNKLEYNLLNNIINSDKYSNIVENIIKDKLPVILDNIKNKYEKIDNDTNIKNINNIKEPNLKVIKDENNISTKEVEIQNNRINTNSVKREIKLIGKTLLKIDSNNLQNIIKVYKTITYAIRDNDNKGYQSTGIRKAAKLNRVYKGYRWLFVDKGKNINETIAQIQPTKESKKKHPIYDSILELNSDKTQIIQSYSGKNDMAKNLNISKTLASEIIANNTKYDNKYYIELYKCPKDLLDNYSGTIKKRIITNTKLVKQINPVTNEEIIFNSMTEITRLLGYNCKTINKAIKNKIILYGFRWEYYNA
jgi:hypothetical protein